MLKNYITIAINNLLKNKLYSAINILGLAIGIATCILITLYIQNELSYDKQWEKSDLIYRINHVSLSEDSLKEIKSNTSFQVLPALKEYFPEGIEFGTRILKNEGELQIDDMRYQTSIALVDKDFPDMFQIKVLKGNLKNTLQSPGNIALSEASAIIYFGNKDPIGEVIVFDDEQYKVTAVYRLISTKTVLNIPSLSLLAPEESNPNSGYFSWNARTVDTFIRFYDGTDIDQFVTRLPDFVNQTIPIDPPPGKKKSDIKGYALQEIRDIYFHPYDSSPTWQTRTGNRTVVALFCIIALLVLVIGCINFVILTTAQTTQRAREVGMRKVVGAGLKQLLCQHLGESLLIVLIAFLIAIGITELSFPFFEAVMDLELAIPYSSPASYVFSLFLVTLVGLSSGLYPALVLSRFTPTRALRANQSTEAGGSFRLRNVLIVFQFTASIVLIIATLTAYFQLLYANQHNPGFNPENLLVLEHFGRVDREHRETLVQELLKLPEVANAGFSSRQPRELSGGVTLYARFRPKKVDLKIGIESRFKNLLVGYNFLETYEISLLSGRYFARDMDRGEPFSAQTENQEELKERRIIINLSAARHLGYATADEAVGEILIAGDPGTSDYREFQIIGVVEDTQYRSLRVKPNPEIYRLAPDVSPFTPFLTVRYQGDYKIVVEKVKVVWHKVLGDLPFKDSNVKQNLAGAFSREKQENRMLIAFAMLSIFIACLGLFGMASFTVDRRVKEIGLRKVMGAKIRDIVKLLGWQFLKPVLIANMIAWPVAIFAMQYWLERFPYRFDSFYMIPICLASGLMALTIAWLTVVSNTTRAARKSPIKALRYE